MRGQVDQQWAIVGNGSVEEDENKNVLGEEERKGFGH